jgi:hypothetical protein
MFKRICIMAVVMVAILAVEDSEAAPRSAKAIRDFRYFNECPKTKSTFGACVGYVIDHKWPLCAGGQDAPANMQWEPKIESLAKDKEEMVLCAKIRAHKIPKPTATYEVCADSVANHWALMVKYTCGAVK